MSRFIALLLLIMSLSFNPVASRGEDAKSDSKAIELYNGKDLTGWGYKTGEKFDGKTDSDDKRFSAKEGIQVK